MLSCMFRLRLHPPRSLGTGTAPFRSVGTGSSKEGGFRLSVKANSLIRIRKK